MCVSRVLRKRIDEELDEKCIVQPGRDIPKEQYVRRRAYTKQHKSVWESAIAKYKHVKCIFQNCHFLALSVEDMISHFGYCNGDGSFAKFTCPYCEGRVTSEKILEIHIRRSHEYEHYNILNSHFLDMGENAVGSDSKQCLNQENESSEGVIITDIKIERIDDEYDEGTAEDDLSGKHPEGPFDDEVGSVQETEVEESILPDDQSADVARQMSNQDSYRGDHIYSKRMGKSPNEDTSDSLLVMKNDNLKHYSGPRNVTDKTINSKVEEGPTQNLKSGGDTTVVEKEADLSAKQDQPDPDSDDSWKFRRQAATFSFSPVQNTRRKVHQSYTNSWSQSIKTNGFARCLVATCNFISLDIFHIQNHFKTCSGVPANGPNLCTICNSWLPSAVELAIHSERCKMYRNLTDSVEVSGGNDNESDVFDVNCEENPQEQNDPLDLEEFVKDVNTVSPGKECKYTGTTETSSKKEKVAGIRISDIIKLKDNGNMDINRIVQPGPALPKGQYLRRRAYTKQHKAVWIAALEKHKYVKCIFQNCHFVAMSLEDMIYHFGYCIGDGSFAKFECPHCGGRLTSKMVLDIHIRMSHPEMATDEGGDDSGETDGSKVDDALPSVEELKKLVNAREVKTYGRHSVRPKTGKDPEVKCEPEEWCEDSEGLLSCVSVVLEEQQTGLEDSASACEMMTVEPDLVSDDVVSTEESGRVCGGVKIDGLQVPKTGRGSELNDYLSKLSESVEISLVDRGTERRVIASEGISISFGLADKIGVNRVKTHKDSPEEVEELIRGETDRKRSTNKRIRNQKQKCPPEELEDLGTNNSQERHTNQRVNKKKPKNPPEEGSVTIGSKTDQGRRTKKKIVIHEKKCKRPSEEVKDPGTVRHEADLERGASICVNSAKKRKNLHEEGEGTGITEGETDQESRTNERVPINQKNWKHPSGEVPEGEKDPVGSKDDEKRCVNKKICNNTKTRKHTIEDPDTIKSEVQDRCANRGIVKNVKKPKNPEGGRGTVERDTGHQTQKVVVNRGQKRKHPPEEVEDPVTSKSEPNQERHTGKKALSHQKNCKRPSGEAPPEGEEDPGNETDQERCTSQKVINNVKKRTNGHGESTGATDSETGHQTKKVVVNRGQKRKHPPEEVEDPGTNKSETDQDKPPNDAGKSSRKRGQNNGDSGRGETRKKGKPEGGGKSSRKQRNDKPADQSRNEESESKEVETDARKGSKRKAEEVMKEDEGSTAEASTKTPRLDPVEDAGGTKPLRRRGRPPKKSSQKTFQVTELVNYTTPKREDEEPDNVEEVSDGSEVKCARCDFTTKRQRFSDHNYRKHVGLSWIEGDPPLDLTNERVISACVRQAFKGRKSATCEICQCVKKSALGFVTHVQNCGKSEEEKEALKVTCPYCPSRVQKYSLPMHLKLSHSDPTGEGKKTAEEIEVLSKRKSAIRAANKFQEVLKHSDEENESTSKALYVAYEKGVSKFPKLPYKIRGLWKKMIKEQKRIPCRRGSCLTESTTVQEARRHHFMCPELPEKSFVCQLCDYYSATEDNMQQHMEIHPNRDCDFIVMSEEEKIEDEVDDGVEVIDPNDIAEYIKNRSRIPENPIDALEAAYKIKFFMRENLLNGRKTRFCRQSLRMTLNSELEEVRDQSLPLSELRTNTADWVGVTLNSVHNHLPCMEESMSFRVIRNQTGNGGTWRKLGRFEGEILEGAPIIFTGGSVLSMSWCKNSCVRSFRENPRQYLAVSSSKDMRKFQDIHETPTNWSGCIQIWDCGVLKSTLEIPKMMVGIIHDSGQVWDLSWFPADMFEESVEEGGATRIGLLAAACQDGTIRIWSICDPQKLKSKFRLPLYRTDPKVILQLEGNELVGCLRLAIGKTGVVAGGYANGMVAIWNLKTISSPFCGKIYNTFILKPYLSFQAHRTSITALSICPTNNRYIATSGLDRFFKMWDLECVVNPVESITKEVCLDNVWPLHWPVTISSFEDVIPGTGKGMVKMFRDAYCDKHRAPLTLDGTCWSLSVNDWMNIICGCNNRGDVKIRYMRNMYMADEKFRLRTGHPFAKTELQLLNEKETESGSDEGKPTGKKKPKPVLTVPRTYEEARRYFGLNINDYTIRDDAKEKPKQERKKLVQCVEEYPITSVNKVCWNPNYGSFKFLAVGYQSGFVRIRQLEDVRCEDEVMRFLREAKAHFERSSRRYP